MVSTSMTAGAWLPNFSTLICMQLIRGMLFIAQTTEILSFTENVGEQVISGFLLF
jgi:hypothetical protein